MTNLTDKSASNQPIPSRDELKKSLDPLAYHVTQEKGTEPAFTGKYWNMHADGTYVCQICGQPLFAAGTKFDSGTGWPSFDRAIPGSVQTRPDDSHGMHRTEVVCSRCGAHLGHLFEDGPKDTTGQRFCINSAALNLEPTPDKKAQ